MFEKEKKIFATELSNFANSLKTEMSQNNQWNIKGFIDVFKNVYTISSDTKVVSKILELQMFPFFLSFAEKMGYRVELASHQNYYPDLSFVNKENETIKFAVDLKTTYINEKKPEFCNGFTLGSHGEYFRNRTSSKNIQYPYSEYAAHFCLGIIYRRAVLTSEFESTKYRVEQIEDIPSVITDFVLFATEKWEIASDKVGSGNTANIGSIKRITDILSGNGVFAKAGEHIFDDYWSNFGRLSIETKEGKRKLLTSFNEYISYRGLPADVKNVRGQKDE